MVYKHPYSEKNQQEFWQYLVNWIIDDIQLISVVANSKFCQFIYQLNPTFVIPCPETVKGIIHTAYNFFFSKLQQIIKDQAKSVFLTLNFWTAKNCQDFLGITCSFLNNSFELNEFTLNIAYVRYPHTSTHILETLEQILNEWKICELVFTVTTDNSSNVKKAILDMKNVNWLGCTAHTLQLVIGKGLKLAEVLIARAKCLIDFFYNQSKVSI